MTNDAPRIGNLVLRRKIGEKLTFAVHGVVVEVEIYGIEYDHSQKPRVKLGVKGPTEGPDRVAVVRNELLEQTHRGNVTTPFPPPPAEE